MIIIFKLIFVLLTWVFFAALLVGFNALIVLVAWALLNYVVGYPTLFVVYLFKKIPVVGDFLGNTVATIVTGGFLIFTAVCIHLPCVFIMLKSLKGRE